MKLKNSTDWSAEFLRRMVSFCCRELGFSARKINAARFANSRSAWGGCAYLTAREISVRIGNASRFPGTAVLPGVKEGSETIADRVECLVQVTAHEIMHLKFYRDKNKSRRQGGHGGSEHLTQWESFRVLRIFRERRDELLAEWNAAPTREAKPKPTAAEKREAAARKRLAEWESKLRRAKTAVAKYRKKVGYYDRRAAAKGQ